MTNISSNDIKFLQWVLEKGLPMDTSAEVAAAKKAYRNNHPVQRVLSIVDSEGKVLHSINIEAEEGQSLRGRIATKHKMALIASAATAGVSLAKVHPEASKRFRVSSREDS